MKYHQVTTSHPISPSSHVNISETLEIEEPFWGMQCSWRQSIVIPPGSQMRGTHIPTKKRLAPYSLTKCLQNWANKSSCPESVAKVRTDSRILRMWLVSSDIWGLWEYRKWYSLQMQGLEISFSARINHGGDNVERREYKETDNSSQPLQSLGGHRRRPLDSFSVYVHVEGQTGCGQKWDTLPRETAMIVYYWWG